MREYSKVGPKFWIGATGKRLRASGMEAQIVAMYLLTSPHANMLGLYYCPAMFIAHETGIGMEGAMKGLQSAIEAGFCEYDEASEVVWVVEMAAYQIADSLKPNDLRVKGVHNEYMSLPSNPYLTRFFDKYKDAFCMTECRESSSPYEGPSKPLRSQEQEQEQKKEQEQETTTTTPPPVSREEPPPVVVPLPGQEAPPGIPDEAPTRAAQLAVLLRRNGADPRTYAGNKGVVSLAELGCTDTEVLSALQTAKQQRQEAHSAQPVSAAYLVPIVAQMRTGPPGANSRPKTRADRYADAARQIAELAAQADAQISGSRTEQRTEIDMGVIDATGNR